MKLQICFSPSRFIDLKAGRWKSAKEEIAFADSLGADYINLWVWSSVLFWNTDWDELNPTAEAFYKDCIVECRRRNLGIIGKLGNWNLPYWAKAEVGVPEVGSGLYIRQLASHRHIARTLNRELQLDGWVVGNEPRIEGTLYGWHPADPQARRHTDEDAIQIAIDKTRAVAPEFDGLRIGYSLEGIDLPPPHRTTTWALAMYWAGTSDLLDYAGINAYPTTISRAPSVWNYEQPYAELCEIAPLWPSEQGIAREWVSGNQQRWVWTERLMDHTTWSDVFSYFMLTDTFDDNWGLIKQDGSVDPVAELLRGEFYRREYFHSVG